jgi:hypothetical protein
VSELLLFVFLALNVKEPFHILQMHRLNITYLTRWLEFNYSGLCSSSMSTSLDDRFVAFESLFNLSLDEVVSPSTTTALPNCKMEELTQLGHTLQVSERPKAGPPVFPLDIFFITTKKVTTRSTLASCCLVSRDFYQILGQNFTRIYV